MYSLPKKWAEDAPIHIACLLSTAATTFWHRGRTIHSTGLDFSSVWLAGSGCDTESSSTGGRSKMIQQCSSDHCFPPPAYIIQLSQHEDLTGWMLVFFHVSPHCSAFQTLPGCAVNSPCTLQSRFTKSEEQFLYMLGIYWDFSFVNVLC